VKSWEWQWVPLWQKINPHGGVNPLAKQNCELLVNVNTHLLIKLTNQLYWKPRSLSDTVQVKTRMRKKWHKKEKQNCFPFVFIPVLFRKQSLNLNLGLKGTGHGMYTIPTLWAAQQKKKSMKSSHQKHLLGNVLFQCLHLTLKLQVSICESTLQQSTHF